MLGSNLSLQTLTCLAFFALFGASCVSNPFSSPSEKQQASGPKDGLDDQYDDYDFGMSDWSPARRDVNASYYFMLAEFAALENNQQIAEKYYEDAYSLDSNAYLGAKWIATKAMRSPEKAMLDAKKMTLLYPRDFEIQMLYGKMLALQGLIDDAKLVFEKAQKISPERIEARLGLLNIYKSQGNINSAIKQAMAIIAIEPSFAEVWGELCKLHVANKAYKKALKAAKRAYDIDSNNPENILLYAFSLEMNGKSKKAISLYESLLRINPSNGDVIQRMVELYKEFGELEDALNLLKDAEERSGKVSAGLRLQMVYIYWELEEYQKASSLLDDLSKRFPESDRIVYMSGLGQEKIGRFTAAIQTYLTIEPASSFYAHGAYRSIILYLQLNDTENAILLAKKMVRTDQKNNKDFYMLLAQIYSDNKSYESAVELLEEAYKRHPHEIRFLFTKAVYLEKKGDYRGSVETLKEVIKKDEKHTSALNFLGYLYAERGENLEEAVRLIKKALELKPDDGFYLDSLGWVYFQKEEYPLALKTLLKANELAPNEGVILEHISDVYKVLGNEKKALEYIEAATKARIDERDKERIENKFNEMNEK